MMDNATFFVFSVIFLAIAVMVIYSALYPAKVFSAEPECKAECKAFDMPFYRVEMINGQRDCWCIGTYGYPKQVY